MRIGFDGTFTICSSYVKVIRHIFVVGKERRMNKTLKKFAIAIFSRR